jgi:hypothetical protein
VNVCVCVCVCECACVCELKYICELKYLLIVIGDPIEDCVSVTTAGLLKTQNRVNHSLVLSVGLGMDR